MKILIAVDMEGISGVVNWDQVDPRHAEYTRFRRIMTQDVNAAIQGCLAAGAKEVVVADGHASGYNILIEELDPRARLNSGNSAPLAMVQGIDASFNAAMFVGYHACAGSMNAILDHTWSSSSVANVWLNGVLVGETGLNAAVCGHFNVPVIMLSGDQTVCAEARLLLGALEVAVVKQATGRTSAECLSLPEAHEKICEAAARGMQKLLSGEAPPPYHLPSPIELRVEFFQAEMADRAAQIPGVRRLASKQVEITAEDMPAAYRAFCAVADMAGGE